MSSGTVTTNLFNMIVIESFIIWKRNIRMSSGTATTILFRIKAEISDSGKELSNVLVSSKRKLREVDKDLVLKSEYGVGLSFNASMLAIRRLIFNNFSQRISSLIVKRISSSIPPTSGITISITYKLMSSESGGDASTYSMLSIEKESSSIEVESSLELEKSSN
nr:hypothetical protein [Tanacetum cinerariifolium]